MRKVVTSLGIAAMLVFGTGATSAEKHDHGSEAEKSYSGFEIAGYKIPNPLAGVRFGNPFDPSTWWDGSQHVGVVHEETMEFNIMDPDFWMSIPNPKTHSEMHGAMTNPANWAQFFKYESYVNMVSLDVLKKWFKLETYNVLFDPQTYAYWMQPGAYHHLIYKDHYVQLLNADAYETLVDTAVGNVGLSFKIPADSLSVGDWLNSVSWAGTDDAKS